MQEKAEKAVPRIGIMATTFTGNHGAEAMLQVCIDQVRTRYPEAEIHVLTYAPKSDSEWRDQQKLQNIWLHSSTPFVICAFWFPLAIALKFLPFLKRPIEKKDNLSINRLLSLDIVIDFAGVSFMDGREKFLPFNVLTLFPFLLHHVPVVKLSQAVGPITSFPNRICARWVLPRLTYLAARGRKTVEFLRSFGLPETNWNFASDTAFLLNLKEKPEPVEKRDGIIFIPSSLMLKKTQNYAQQLTETIRDLLDCGIKVSILAHSWKEGNNLPRNNDFPLCKNIHEALGEPNNVLVYGPGLNARGLKQIISQHRIAVTSRFHGMIAALDSETPVWVLGWSHKYWEVLAEFGLEECALKTNSMSPSELSEILQTGYEEAPQYAEKLTENLTSIREQCAQQFEQLFKIIDK